MEELKRCPFCGGYSWLISNYDHDDNQWYFYAECTQCGVEQKYFSKSKEEAIEKWDRRAEEPVQRDIVHCRECVYGDPKGKYGCKLYHYQQYKTHDMGPDDFCSKGKRRAEDYHAQNLKTYAHDFNCTVEEAEEALTKGEEG